MWYQFRLVDTAEIIKFMPPPNYRGRKLGLKPERELPEGAADQGSKKS